MEVGGLGGNGEAVASPVVEEDKLDEGNATILYLKMMEIIVLVIQRIQEDVTRTNAAKTFGERANVDGKQKIRGTVKKEKLGKTARRNVTIVGLLGTSSVISFYQIKLIFHQFISFYLDIYQMYNSFSYLTNTIDVILLMIVFRRKQH